MVCPHLPHSLVQARSCPGEGERGVSKEGLKGVQGWEQNFAPLLICVGVRVRVMLVLRLKMPVSLTSVFHFLLTFFTLPPSQAYL